MAETGGHRMYRLFVSLSFAVALSGCVSALPIETPLTEMDRPALNQMVTAELGALILEKGKYKVVDALISRNDIVLDYGPLRVVVTIPAGVLTARLRDDKYTYYFSSRTTARDPLAGDIGWSNNTALRVANDNPGDVQAVSMPLGERAMPDVPPVLERTKIPIVDGSGYRQQLLYSGRSGDILKFQYRGSGSVAGPEPNEDIQWNLRDGNVVAFKGARIEVVDATNARLNYRVLSSFTDMSVPP